MMSEEQAETTTRSATPTRNTSKPAAGGRPEIQTASKMRIKMETGMSGYTPIPLRNEDGKPVFSPTTGKQVMTRGADYVRQPGLEYDVETEEAQRLIDAGYATVPVSKVV